MKRALIIGLALLLTLSGCATTTGPKETIGTGLGALGGGLLGAQVGSGSGRLWATGIGVLAGAFLGNQIGESLDRADRHEMERTTQRALEHNPTDTSAAWTNPDTGNYGSVTPTRTYYASNKPCREYTQSVTIGGQQETVVGNACRETDGTWRVVR